MATATRKRAPKTNIELPPIVADPVESAQLAGLRYVTDEMPGIRRKRGP
jgi:hypothetical protein